MENYWRLIFEEQLAGWSQDENDWPEKLSLAMFKQWFEVTGESVVVDLESGPIKHEIPLVNNRAIVFIRLNPRNCSVVTSCFSVGPGLYFGYMGCPGGACGKDGLEQRMLLCAVIVALFSVGLIWISGYHKTAYALLSIPVLIAVAGPQLSRGLDLTVAVTTRIWRTYARRPGGRYCPECAGALSPLKTCHPVSGGECPKCDGTWCDSRELMRWLTAYGTNDSTWLAIPRDETSPPMLCPECAVPLELGSLDRLQPVFARCGPCSGHWISRMTWTWFELTPPARAKSPLREEARAPSPTPVHASRKIS